MMIYLDANATEPLRPQALAAMVEAAQLYGNPSSIHREGRAARSLLEAARGRIAARMGALAEKCVFTSGGTEANAMAVYGLGAGRRLLIGATEHDAVRRTALDMAEAGAALEWLPVGPDGVLCLESLEASLAAGGPALVCVMLANNETGVLHPITEVARLCAAHGALLHVDAVQAAGRVPIDLATLGADSLAISGHKAGGPKGAGALLLAKNAPRAFPPLMAGGGQESGRRGGTQALPAISAMAAALEVACEQSLTPIAAWRDAMEQRACAAGAVICGEGAPRLGNTTCLALPGRRADAQLIALDLAGICVSAGSACSSGKIGQSHVLDAMGLNELAGCAIRVSLPWNVQAEAVELFGVAYARMAATGIP